MPIQAQTSVTQKNRMILDWNKKKKEWPKTQVQKIEWLKMQIAKKLKKVGNKDWFLNYYIVFIPYHFISSYAGVADS